MRTAFLLAPAVLATQAVAQPAQSAPPADLIVTNARISTVDESQPLADVVVLDQDILRVAPELVLRTKMLATDVGGNAVHERKSVVP